MNEPDANGNDVDSWPLPSLDVLRELDPPEVVWAETESVSSWPLRPPARG
ncbi:MAG TPA: hypothetical protein VHZ77_03185 [Gaiellaceae bacterium]|jgi:hypothetical protein|nr:hypothetical protein [Gaiellaceae bacterium]